MVYRFFFFLIISFLFFNTVHAQNKDARKISLRGMVTDANLHAIRGAYIYVDSLKTKAETNKKGRYRIKIDPGTRILTAFSPRHGMISLKYSGEEKLNFIFPKNNKVVDEQDMKMLGFVDTGRSKDSSDKYLGYNSILEILDVQFPMVRVNGDQIIVGKGPHVFNADSRPFILVDGQPTRSLSSIPPSEVKNIRVIHRGSELAQYGLQGANGVIIITLKK